jgi:outer membrane beta-barrel protein
MTARRLSLALALAALPALAAAQSSKADAFAGKIPPVSGQLFRTAGRLELTIAGAMSLNDAFFTKYFGTAKVTYHFTDAWSAGAYASGGTAVLSGSSVLCSSTTGCANAGDPQLWQVPGRILYVFGVEAGWTPVYAKLNVLSEQVGHFDLTLLGGPDLIFHDEIVSAQQAAVLAASGESPGSQSTLGGHLGLAARFFLSPSMALRLEFKDYVYGVKVPNNPAVGTDFQNQLFIELGLSFYFPTRNPPAR